VPTLCSVVEFSGLGHVAIWRREDAREETRCAAAFHSFCHFCVSSWRTVADAKCFSLRREPSAFASYQRMSVFAV